jgi:hypothetical protein
VTKLGSVRLWTLLPAALALAILALGVPQFADSALRLYAGEADDVTGGEGPASRQSAAATAAMLEAIDGWLGDPRARIRAGILRLRLASATGAAREPQPAELAHGIADLDDGLARAPGDAFAWAALAQGQLASGDWEAARRALEASMRLAGYEPGLSIMRAALGLRIFFLLSEDDRRLWADQVRLAWDRHPAELLAIARDAEFAALLKRALGRDPARLEAFAKALAAGP